MGILSNTVSICQFMVVGNVPASEVFEWASTNLARVGFTPIDHSVAELSAGWVHVDDHRENSFAVPAAFWRDHYLVFTLRQDKRSIPTVLLRSNLQLEEREFLAANPGYTKVPKQKKEELREAVRTKLLARVLPVPSTYDAVWDTDSNILTLATVGSKAVEQFETLFKKTFEGLRLVVIHPYSRAERLLLPETLAQLAKANKANSDAVLDLIKSNRWLGWDFLLWMMYRTMNESSEYRVSQPGPAVVDESFVAYLNDRMVLGVSGENGVQKFTASGPMEQFAEVRTALKSGKLINEATLYLERGELSWKMTLKGEQFQFASFRSPQVKEEKDNTVDAVSEREALFYERMYVLELGLQLFDSLYLAFLELRLGSEWDAELKKINSWLDES
ncbi:recombination-associated protein RdgC [Geobacter pelophilus]|uniref:Recombination-associated protein RdgC n=1 Tax=Geoanaerobacter pelophilus TaxID=60036 RepID=A0AAW4L224_9BACT|nr:recombination-associated protein RdgC [Geoanaerobacter pelophilus]MBT0662680.1 recombination-associated protein RdgC [Geoanaerobacter pelophilus]